MHTGKKICGELVRDPTRAIPDIFFFKYFLRFAQGGTQGVHRGGGHTMRTGLPPPFFMLPPPAVVWSTRKAVYL